MANLKKEEDPAPGWTLRKVQNRIFLKTMLESQSISKAGESIGISHTSASWKWRNDKSFREDLKGQLVKLGLDDEGIASKLLELLSARQHGLTKDGDVVDMGPDAHAQVKAMDQLLKVTGAYPDPRLDLNAQIASTVVYMRPEDQLTGGDIFGEIIDVTPEVSELPEPQPVQDPEAELLEDNYH